MKTALLAGLSIAFGMSVLPPAHGATIERNAPQGGPSSILESVQVPAGTAMIYLSGELADAQVSATGEKSYGDTEAQTESVLRKIEASLIRRGFAMKDVIKLTVFLTADPNSGRMDFAGMSKAYRRLFGTSENPGRAARSTVQVAGLVAPEYLVEIEAVAAKPSR
jgi:enamine deaminase RidA (YjgF/YER057c/UK114 family)